MARQELGNNSIAVPSYKGTDVPAGVAPDLSAEVAAEHTAPRNLILRFITNPYLTLVSRLCLAGIFILSGLTKLGVPDQFVTSIDSYEMPLPRLLVDLMANWLPALELGLGIFLLLGLFTKLSGWVSTVLMLIFLIAMVQAWLRGLSPNCGCFSGPQGNPLGNQLVHALGPVGTFLANEKVGVGSIGRDVVFLLMSIQLIFVPTVFSLDSLRARYNRTGEEEYDADEYEEEGPEAPAEE